MEEQAFLVAGPGRAAEVSVLSLVEAGALRISRDGLVSPIQSHARPRTPLQARVLQSVPRPLGDLIAVTAGSPEADGLRRHLIDRGLVVPAGRRRVLRGVGRLLVLAAVLVTIAAIALELPFVVAAGTLVGSLLVAAVLGRAGRPLTAAGRAQVRGLRQAAATAMREPGMPNRVTLVAAYGLLGKVHGQYMWRVIGIAPTVAATLRRRSRGQGSAGGASCGGGCGSCSSSSCGGGSSSDSGSSSSSDSGGSSWGGGSSCGGGGGGD